MTWFILGTLVGLIVGWNLLPQPLWVKAIYDKMKGKVDEKIEDIKE